MTRPMPTGYSLTHTLTLDVPGNRLPAFTALFQSGASLTTSSTTSLGSFLANLPGFDPIYLTERVQTIFLDGNATDNLDTPLTRPRHVIALSAAMPGLAGAIFRKNSLLATLRTRNESEASVAKNKEEIEIQLKLFNSIALEKGCEILKQGAVFSGSALHQFLTLRRFLLACIRSISLDNRPVPKESLLETLDQNGSYRVNLKTDKETDITTL